MPAPKNPVRTSLAALWLAVSALTSPLVHAAETPATKPMQACRADIGRLCKSVSPGGGRMAACLQEHKAELSPECAAQADTLAQCAAETRKLCGDDAKPRAMRSCLKDHAAELTPACGKLAQ